MTVPPIPAATLILFRARDDGPDEHLFVVRSAKMSFAAGAVVFPGGRVDAGDHVLAAGDEGAARVAAIRETIEESGVPVGLDPLPGPAALERLRAGLREGHAFGALLAAEELRLDLAALTPFARWCPDHPNMKVFDTRFFLARLPVDAPEAEVDATENERLFWASAQAVLDMSAAGEVQMIFPTRRNLERLASLGNYAAAVEQAHALPQPVITPWENGGRLWIPEGLGYPVVSEVLERVRRA